MSERLSYMLEGNDANGESMMNNIGEATLNLKLQTENIFWIANINVVLEIDQAHNYLLYFANNPTTKHMS